MDIFSLKKVCPMAKQNLKVRQVLDVNSYPGKGKKVTKRYRVIQCDLNQEEKGCSINKEVTV